jgi:hypothetical protein
MAIAAAWYACGARREARQGGVSAAALREGREASAGAHLSHASQNKLCKLLPVVSVAIERHPAHHAHIVNLVRRGVCEEHVLAAGGRDGQPRGRRHLRHLVGIAEPRNPLVDLVARHRDVRQIVERGRGSLEVVRGVGLRGLLLLQLVDLHGEFDDLGRLHVVLEVHFLGQRQHAVEHHALVALLHHVFHLEQAVRGDAERARGVKKRKDIVARVK